MPTAIRNWVQSHRYQITIRQLQALSAEELRALGIAPSQIEHLATEVSGIGVRPRSCGRSVTSRPNSVPMTPG
jgi:uncharacterized protein YjiS (DUF1127 family)